MKHIRVWLTLLITITALAALPRPSYAEQAGSAGHRVAAASVASGGAHTCAILTYGTVRCWGDNSEGALGSATNFGSGSAPNPTPLAAVPLGARATALSAGTNHTCALLTSGKVRCWGSNHAGELGTTALLGTATPVPQAAVPLGRRAIAITSGGAHTCALLINGTVRCWGDNASGQLGVPAGTSTPVPQPAVALGGRATAVATGLSSTCAVLATGKVRCWGDNLRGQLGSTHNASSSTPNPTPLGAVALGARATAVAVGREFACALLVTGKVRCWGDNDSGQLASTVNAGIQAANPAPVAAASLGAAATAIAAGSYHACAALVTGKVRCWGYNNFGQDGSSTNMGTTSPVPAPQPAITLYEGGTTSPAVAVELGDYFSCAVTAAGHAHCWGANSPYGPIGVDPATTSQTPDPVQVAMGHVRVRAATGLSLSARPTTDRRAPYAFAVRGRVTGAFVPDAATCAGSVRVRLALGTTTLASKRVALGPTCGWHATVTAPTTKLHHGSNRLTVTATFAVTTNLAGAHRRLTVTAVK